MIAHPTVDPKAVPTTLMAPLDTVVSTCTMQVHMWERAANRWRNQHIPTPFHFLLIQQMVAAVSSWKSSVNQVVLHCCCTEEGGV
jgi:hypothetical protein